MSWQRFDVMEPQDTIGLIGFYQPMMDDPADDPAPKLGVIVANDGKVVTLVPLAEPKAQIIAPIEDFDLVGFAALLDMSDEQVAVAEAICAKHGIVR